MNSKMVAFLAALVMLVSGVALASTVQAEPDYGGQTIQSGDVDLGVYYLDITYGNTAKEEIVPFKFNEMAYNVGYDSYEFKFELLGTGDSEAFYTYSSGTRTNTTTTQENIVFSIASGSNAPETLGTYELKLTPASTEPEAGVYEFRLQASVSVTTGGVKENITPTTYYFKLYVTDDSTITFTETSLTFTQNVNMFETLTVSEPSDFNVTDYTWYAVGLPAGLNVVVNSGSLEIRGMAVEDITSKEVKIVGRDSNGSEVTGTIEITVEAAPTINYLLKSNNDTLKHEGDVWIKTTVGADEDVQVQLVITGTTTANVTVIDNDGTRKPASVAGQTDNTVTFTIPTDGAGTYLIEMDVGGSVTVATLHVVPVTTGAAGAGFIVVGN